MSNIRCNNAVIFITGANRQRGIGRALVEVAVKKGAKKIYATARIVDELNDLTLQFPDIIIPLNLDVTNKIQVDQVAKLASDTQILINNSGVSQYSGVCFNHNDEIARQEFEVNFWGVFNLTRAFCSNLIKNKNGAIVNIISIAGLSAFPLCATYSASKAATHSLTQSIRAELMPYGVPVFGVYPGPIDTDMADGINFYKETPAVAATRILDGIEQGIEDISVDNFGGDFINKFKADYKALEKDLMDHAHKLDN